MLRIIETFGNLPTTIEPDPDAHFQPGNVASLWISKSKSVVGVCDGLHPFGILDDIRSDTLRTVCTPDDGIHIAPALDFYFDPSKKEVVLAQDHKIELKHANIIAASFASSVSVQLRSKEGIAIVPAGTACNYCLHPSISGEDFNNAVRFAVRYAYNVPSGVFDDSTQGSNRATIWTKNMIAATDMFDTTQEYPQYAPLYANCGLLTSKKIDARCKCVGVVLEPPKAQSGMLRFLLDLDGKVDVKSCSI